VQCAARGPEYTGSKISTKLVLAAVLYGKCDASKQPSFDRNSGVGVDFMQWPANSSPRFALSFQSGDRYEK
jgi:hypothetical protein